MNSTKRVNIDVEKEVWKMISVYASENEMTKKEVVDLALKALLEMKVKK